VRFIAESTANLAGARAAPATATVGSAFESDIARRVACQVFDPRGRRTMMLDAATSGPRLVPEMAGYYEVRGGGRSDFIAVNVDPRESRLEHMGEPTVKRWQACRPKGLPPPLPRRRQPLPARPSASFRSGSGFCWRRGACFPGAAGGELSPARAAGAARMSSRENLDLYLQRARARLKLVLLTQGAALLAGALLVVTVLAGLWLTRAVFSDTAAGIGRALLVAALLAVAVFAFLRWRDLQRNAGADALERALPAQEGRIHTYLQ
jgi:hypothetical protein